jgi:hypothetical protein
VSVVRSVLVVVAALLLLGFIDQTLERTLVGALGGTAVTDVASYLAIRNRPVVLSVTMVTHAFAALLTGYMLGRLAGTQEVRHATAAAVLATLLMVAASTTANEMLPPVWVRVAMGVITPPALIAGAYVRGQARIAREQA